MSVQMGSQHGSETQLKQLVMDDGASVRLRRAGCAIAMLECLENIDRYSHVGIRRLHGWKYEIGVHSFQ